MLRKAMFLTVALMMALTVNASAQCTFGVYADAEGTLTSVVAERELGQPLFQLDVYYVVYVEDYVAGAAWNREISGAYSLQASIPDYDPTQQFLEITADGYRFGTGQCQFGFGGRAISVMRETLWLFDDFSGGTGFVQVTPNAIEDATAATLTNCSINADKYPCGDMGSLLIEGIVPAEGSSFGAMKALYK